MAKGTTLSTAELLTMFGPGEDEWEHGKLIGKLHYCVDEHLVRSGVHGSDALSLVVFNDGTSIINFDEWNTRRQKNHANIFSYRLRSAESFCRGHEGSGR